MKSINKLFTHPIEKKLLSIFFTAGFKPLNQTTGICLMLEKAGVDFIELGIPGSDPLADGPVIQESSTIALQNGFTLEKFFESIKDLKSCKIPVFIMGYYNQVLQYGEEKFVRKAMECGIAGFIIPDQPIDSLFHQRCNQYDLANVRMICPTTPIERIKLMDEISTGFIYAVSTSSTTGNRNAKKENYLSALKNETIKNPLITGFGIRDKNSFTELTQDTNGGIVGTAFIQFLKKHETINQEIITEFVRSIN